MENMVIIIVGWIAFILSLIGNVFVIYKHWAGFLVWIIANIFWVTVDLYAGLYSQGILFVIYAGLAVWGLIKWRRYKEQTASLGPWLLAAEAVTNVGTDALFSYTECGGTSC